MYGQRVGNYELDTFMAIVSGYMITVSQPDAIGIAAVSGGWTRDILELMDAVYLHNKYVEPVGYDDWVRLRQLVDWLCDNWKREDEGIWEVRSGPNTLFEAHVLGGSGPQPTPGRETVVPRRSGRWLKVRDEMYEEVMVKGWNPQRKAFVQAYGSDALDASSLLMPLVFFLAPNDPRMLSTIDAIRQPVAAGGLSADGLVYRYDPATPNGLSDREGTFNMCSFWLVEALHPRRPNRSGGWKMPGCSSSRCSAMPTISACTPSRRATAARLSATSRRRSPTWP